MSKYTKDEPFEFEGGLYCFQGGAFMKVYPEGATPSWDRAACNALIEAERDEWHYINDEHTQARKGRWVAQLVGDVGCIFHDEAGVVSDWVSCVTNDRTDEARIVREDFLAWHAAQKQPAEPTGFGYVGTVTGEKGDVWDVFRDNWGTNACFDWVRRSDGESEAGAWPAVLALGKFEGVTQ